MILLFFGFTAVVGALIGRQIDLMLDIRPFGSLFILGIAFVTSWIVIFSLRKKLLKLSITKEESNSKLKAQNVSDTK